MRKNPDNSKVGDTKSPASRKSAADLRDAVDFSAKAPATMPQTTYQASPISNAVANISAEVKRNAQPSKCRQRIWFSFFFDGTGNNLEADMRLQKHSNIARLYRAHLATNAANGLHSIYIPGIGTYFREIRDPGGTVTGAAFGAMGEARLRFALEEFDRYLKLPILRAVAPANAIEEISVAVFGFSRGAALARAFVNTLMETRCKFTDRKWILRQGSWPVRFSFMGLFDTVASVGQPMSQNNTDYYNPMISDVRGMLDERAEDYADTRPVRLAFSDGGVPGADPAPGKNAGHSSWAEKLEIHESVEEVRHFVAAHEIRNSFPLDSISVMREGRIVKPAHFFEVIYPGAHSDVGGGYAAGEGAKSLLEDESLSLIPLRHMYDFAVSKGVPMQPEGRLILEDFRTSSDLREAFNKYMQAVGSAATLGEGFNRHMKFYLAWRFQCMRRNAKEKNGFSESLRKEGERFRSERAACESKLKVLEQQLGAAEKTLIAARGASDAMAPSSDMIEKAKAEVAARKHEYFKMKAERDAIPDMSRVYSLTPLYDRQLLDDAQSIRSLLQSKNGKYTKSNLRPHYQGLVDSYEDEIFRVEKNPDVVITRIFEQYVHDSLAGFGRDATYPSDPRVIYVGGDEKLRFAAHTNGAKDITVG
jgi:uncharacterized protein (DUF2235 family)